MTAIPAQLPSEVRSYLHRFAARCRWQRLLGAAGLATCVTLVWVVAWCVVDRVIALHWTARLTVLMVNVAAVIMLLARPVGTLLRRVDPPRVAAEVERREPRFAQRLATLTSRALGPAAYRGSPQLLAALGQDVAGEVRRHRPGELLKWGPPLRSWVIVAVLLVVLAALSRWSWLDLPALGRRYAMPLAKLPAVTSTRLTVRPGDVELPEGDALVVQVEAVRLGDVPPMLHLRTSGESWHDQLMSSLADGRFEARVRDVDHPLEYFVTGGDARSEVRRVSVLPKPAIRSFRVRYAYPPYTQLPPREVSSSIGEIEAPAGTEVTLMIETTEPLKLAVMTIGGAAARMEAVVGQPNLHQATFVVRDDRRYTIRMASARDVSGAFRGGSIRVIPDRPPVVMLRPAGPDDRSSGAPDGDAIAASYQAADDYGLSRLDAEITLDDDSDGPRLRTVSIPLASPARATQGTFTPDLRQLGAAPGERMSLRIRVEDRAGQFDVSAPLELIIPPGATTMQASPPSAATQPTDAGTPIDPAGFGEALEAYFDVLRGK
jgi:hypothetical protein